MYHKLILVAKGLTVQLVLQKHSYMSLCYDLDRDDSKPVFFKALRVWMVQFHTEFGYKSHIVSQDIILNLCETLTLNKAVQLRHKTLELLMRYYQTCAGYGSAVQKIKRNSHIFIQ